MTTRALERACLAFLVLGVLAFGCSFTRSFARQEPPATTAVSASDIEQLVIDIEGMVHHLRGKPEDQAGDALRDWAVYGTLIHMRLDPAAILRASSKILPVRPPSSAPPIDLAQGWGRRVVVSNEDALLFVDDDDPDPAGTIDRLAREVRAEAPQNPPELHVFRISPDITAAEIRVKRMPWDPAASDADADRQLASASEEPSNEWAFERFKVSSVVLLAAGAKPRGGRGGGRSRFHGSDGPSHDSTHSTSRGSSHGQSYHASHGHYEKPRVSAPTGVPWYRWKAPERPRRPKPASSEIHARSTSTVWSGPQSVRIHLSVLAAGQIRIETKYHGTTFDTLSGGQAGPDRVKLQLDPGEGAEKSVTRSVRLPVHIEKGGRDLVLARTPSGAAELDRTMTSAAATRAVSQDELAALIETHQWQRLTIEKGQGAQGSAASVQYAFRNTGPSPAARAVTLEHDSDFPDFPTPVKMHIEPDGTVFIQKLAVNRGQWQDLDLTLALSPRDMQRIAGKVRAGAMTVRRADVTDIRAERTYHRMRAGDSRGALHSIRESIHNDAAEATAVAEGLRTKAVDEADRLLAGGNGAKARSLYDFAAEVGGHSPEIELRSALAEIQSGLPKRALGRLGDPARLTPEAIAMIEATPMLGDLPDVVAARKNPSQHILGVPPTEIDLVADGTEVRSALKVSRMPEGEEISMSAREDIAATPAETVFYIDDRISLNRHDLEVEGYGRLTEIAQTPDVQWQSVVMAGELHRPGILVDTSTQTRYRRHTSSALQAGSSGKLRVVRIHHRRGGCDVDCNGVITDDERAACSMPGGCDVNCNGVVSDDERAACPLHQAAR